MSGESELAAAREEVRAALEARMAGEDAEEDLAEAASALLAATETYIGECQQASPPGKLFYALDMQDGLVVRCTHDPYHQAKP